MRQPYPWEATLIVFVFLVFLVGLNLVFGVLQAVAPEPLMFSPLLIIGELFLLVSVVVWGAVRRYPWRQTYLLYQPGWIAIGLSVLLAITWWPVATGLGTLLEQLFSLIGPPPEIPTPRNAIDAAGFLIAIVVLAPLCEEPIFRGFIMRGWLRFGAVAAIVGSGLLFGLQHAQLGGLIPLSMVGVLLALVAFRAGSIWPSIIIHAIYNGISVPFLIWPEAMPEISDAALIGAGFAAMPVAAGALWLFYRLVPPRVLPSQDDRSQNQVVAAGIAVVLVLAVFSVMALLEIFVRLNPELGAI